ncbi:probable protein UPS1, mitochondrial [Zygosaccharomyces bailii]|nr:probable protein UPS1, mitochondrial [Zygosaccharomyces bailii]
MVLWHKNAHVFDGDFRTVTLAFFNRYPNPYASHVLSIDTLSRELDHEGKLRTTRLIKKTGKLPRWIRPFLGGISDSWIIEFSVVDPRRLIMKTFTRNLDHTKIIQVEEYTTYQQAEQSFKRTACASQVKFSSGFNVGIRNKIENWSRTKFDENIKKSRLGMVFVMQELEKSRALL